MESKRDNDYYVLTSAVGKFTFSKEVVLSHAKLIRDSVTAQRLKPQPGLMLIRSAHEATTFMLEHVAGPASRVNFDVVFTK